VNAVRRSTLLQIAFLCFAVIFGGTARAASSVEAFHHCEQHCSTKTTAEAPTPEDKLTLKVSKPAPGPQSRFAFSDLALHPATREAIMLPSQQTLRAFSQKPLLTLQARPFVLRI
jgi:hypothetical protein